MGLFHQCWVLLTLFVSFAHSISLTSSGGLYIIDAGSIDSFSVSISQKTCDVSSIVFVGTQVQSNADHSTQISSGWSKAAVTAETINVNGTTYVKVTCVSGDDPVTQYYVIRDRDSSLHIATYVSGEPAIGELRFIARLSPTAVPYDEVGQASSITGGSAIEGKDVFLVGNQTRSKFFSSKRFIDDQVHCLSGNKMKACMVIPGTAYEHSSGGPFHRDINTNPTDGYNGLYWYMNSGHVQTELPYRTGLNGPYALAFSRSTRPSGILDTSFWGALSVKDFVPVTARGYVQGVATGIDSKRHPIVLHWHNAAAQYWAYANSNGTFTSPAMRPGTYTMVLYQDELLVGTTTGINVAATSVVTKNIASTWTIPSTTLFQIGEWDNRPTGFRNAALQPTVHPSDKRMAPWKNLVYTVGKSALDDFPMAIWKSYTDPVTIKVTLTATQASGAATLRIGTTLSFQGGRPTVTVNGHAYPTPAVPSLINSRGVTRGAYRGYGERYDFNISAGQLVEGVNTIVIAVASTSAMGGYLQPNFIFDAVHLFR